MMSEGKERRDEDVLENKRVFCLVTMASGGEANAEVSWFQLWVLW